MIHTNPPPFIVNSRTLSRPPLQTIPTNPLTYNLSSTNTHKTQHSIYSSEHNTQTATLRNSIQHQNIPVPSTPFYQNQSEFQQTLTIYKQIPHIQTIK